MTTAHRLRWVDGDGSGKKMLAVAPLIGPEAVEPDYKSPIALHFYRAPDWKRETITDSFTGLVHGLQPVLWDGVKGEALRRLQGLEEGQNGTKEREKDSEGERGEDSHGGIIREVTLVRCYVVTHSQCPGSETSCLAAAAIIRALSANRGPGRLM